MQLNKFNILQNTHFKNVIQIIWVYICCEYDIFIVKVLPDNIEIVKLRI